jgi:hypothetical protein
MELPPKDKIPFAGYVHPDGALVGIPDFFQAFYHSGAQVYLVRVDEDPINHLKKLFIQRERRLIWRFVENPPVKEAVLAFLEALAVAHFYGTLTQKRPQNVNQGTLRLLHDKLEGIFQGVPFYGQAANRGIEHPRLSKKQT